MIWQCGAIDSGVTIFPDAKIRPCCLVSADYSKPISEITNPNRFQDIKNEDKPEACRACWSKEINGWKSIRPYYDSGIGATKQIKFLDIRNTNQCNIKCRYCGPHFSNQWAKELSIFPAIKQTEITHLLDTILTEDLIDLYFTGGEPFISADHFNVITKLIDMGYSKNIVLRYNTNLTVLGYKNNDFFKLWKNFKKVHITVSIDAIGTELEHIRSGASWTTINNNLETIQNKNLKNLTVTLSPVVSLLNIWFLPDLLKFTIAKNLQVDLIPLYGPDYLDISAIPKDLKPLANEKLNKIKDHIKNSKYNELIYKLDNVDNEFLFTTTLRHILLLDKLRNENLFDLLPFKQYAIDNTLRNNEYE